MEPELLEASARHPGLPAPDATLAAFVAEKRAAAGDAPVDLDGLVVAHAAACGDQAAVAEIHALLAGLRPALRRTGADEQLLNELLADLPGELVTPREGAAPRILGYSGKGPLGAWLRVIAARALVERRRKIRPSVPIEEEVGGALARTHDPELELLKRTYKAQLERAFRDAFASLSAEERLLLIQHHKDGLNVDKLAALHGVHRATAARRVAAARDAFTREVRAVLARELAVGHETFDSIVRLVQSELSLHLSRYG